MTDLQNRDAAASADDTAPIDTRYLDASLPIAERVEILLAQMTLEEKAGLLFQTVIGIGPDGTLAEERGVAGGGSTDEFVNGLKMNHFNIHQAPADPGAFAEWHNRLQELAAATRLGIPAR